MERDQRAESTAIHEIGFRQIDFDILLQLAERATHLVPENLRIGGSQLFDPADVQCLALVLNSHNCSCKLNSADVSDRRGGSNVGCHLRGVCAPEQSGDVCISLVS